MITENNKIIAKFMGATLTKDLQIMYPVYEGDSSYVKDLKYHLDWNWLMEVVESVFKVEEFIKDDLIFKLNDTLLEVNKTSLYNACLDCIKWYNENKI